MSLLDTLDARERAEQLRNPSGDTGLAVADLLAPVNREANLQAIAELGLERGDRVLEIGCGLGAMAAVVHAAAEGVGYMGLDPSPTMVEAALDRNAQAVQADATAFVLGRAEHMPFEDARFTKVFSVGVIHFWEDPIRAMADVARVMRPGARMVMACLGPERAPAFALEDFGFYLRNVEQWRLCCLEVGLQMVEVRTSSLGGANGPQTMHVSASR